jgi:hypothetical protein
MGHTIDAQGDIGSEEDLLEASDAKLSAKSSPLWRELKTDGLQPPRVNLLGDLRKQKNRLSSLGLAQSEHWVFPCYR